MVLTIAYAQQETLDSDHKLFECGHGNVYSVKVRLALS